MSWHARTRMYGPNPDGFGDRCRRALYVATYLIAGAC